MGILESLRGPDVGKLETRQDVEGLLAALGHKKTQVRLCAAKALGRLRDRRAVEALIVALADADWEVRQAAGDALGELGDKRAVEPLIALLNTTDSTSAMEILNLYREQGEAGVYRLDWEQIKAGWVQVRKAQAAAIRALGKVGDQGAVGPLVQALERRLWLRRWANRFGAGGVPNPEEVIQALEDENEAIRLLVCLAVFWHLKHGSIESQLQYLLVDSSGFSKLQPKAVDALVSALKTTDQFSGRDALGRVIGLVKMRPDAEFLVETAILQALGRLGGDQARKVLTEIREKPASPLREIAGVALEQMVESQAKPDQPQPSITWRCARCDKTLTPLDWTRVAVTIGKLPVLYDGVVCSECGKLECVQCKGSSANAPCSWCSGPVSPAYEHLLK